MLTMFNVLFVTERVLNTICAFSLDRAARKHDVTVLLEAWFYSELVEIMDGWIILADKRCTGCDNEVNCIAGVLKENMKERKLLSKKY